MFLVHDKNAPIVKYEIGTPVLHSDRANYRIGFIFENVENEKKIVWLDENNKGESISGLPVNLTPRYIEAAERANIQSVTSARLFDYIEQAHKATKARHDVAREKRKAEESEREAFLKEARARLPSDAKAVIIAELMQDKCDRMSDYYHSVATKVLILAWSKHTRDLFPEMRKAALNSEETKHLFDAPESAEHREKYSMGGGYYLKTDWRYSSGWKISKVPLVTKYTKPTDDIAEGIPTGEWCLDAPKAVKPASVPSVSNGEFELSDGTKAGFVQIAFTNKPSEEVRNELKSAGFRWSRHNSVWYGKADNLPKRYK